jgi:hypothetical protein
MTSKARVFVTLDPRDEGKSPDSAILAPRPTTLDGKVIGLFSNNKPHAEELLRMIADLIGEQYSIKGTIEYNKGGHQWPASQSLLQELAQQCDVAIHATAE